MSILPHLDQALIYTWSQNYIPLDKAGKISKLDEFKLLHDCCRDLTATSVDVNDTILGSLFDKISQNSVKGSQLICDALHEHYLSIALSVMNLAKSQWFTNYRHSFNIAIYKHFSFAYNGRVKLLVVVVEGELSIASKWYRRGIELNFIGKIEEYEIDFQLFVENLIRDGYVRDILSYF